MEAEIFFSYSHKDRRYLEKLKKHLVPLQRERLIRIWYDRNISAGTEWDKEIDIHLNSAHIILLLVSPDFIESEYCYGKEVKKAIERHDQGEAIVIPVILRPISWQTTLFGKLQPLPPEAKPINDTTWVTQDNACLKVAEGIRLAIQELSQKQTETKPILLENVAKASLMIEEPEPLNTGDEIEASAQSLSPSSETDQLSEEPELSEVLHSYKEKLAKMEAAIDLGGPYTLTEHFAETLNSLLIEIIATIRTIHTHRSYVVANHYFMSKEDVLENIRQAKIQVMVAIGSLPPYYIGLLDRGRPEAFYQHLNTCREYLQKALNCW